MVNIEDYLNTYGAEVSIVTNSFFTWKNINKVASEDAGIFEAINTNALTWNVILNSLQSTYFITLGRIFDINGESLVVRARRVHEFYQEFRLSIR